MSNCELSRKNSPPCHGSILRKGSQSHQIEPVSEEVLYLGKSLQLSKYTFKNEFGESRSAEIIRKRSFLINNGKSSDVEEDTILSLAILKRHILCDCLILVHRYRPTLKSFTLEFPAKIIEQRFQDQSADLAAKEIKDNTGYGSTIIKYVSPETSTDPELCDSKVKLVSMIIDGDDPIKNNFIGSKKIPDPDRYFVDNIVQHQLDHDDDDGKKADRFEGDPNESKQKVAENSSNNNDDGIEYDPNIDDDYDIILLPINGLLDRLNDYCENGTIVDSRVYSFAIGLKSGEQLRRNGLQPTINW
ncbi:ADP-sugar pyrophosphatase [Sarcoptes scabiei]|uniref:ADP-sugar pyrophosphatase n=1 Tax=Sarcoptes scabiei TaxID=52283 RepID=A0A834REF7_SARSC|nr:ADP-sugar pyrophosphatase [Sarcoptes scabiei]